MRVAGGGPAARARSTVSVRDADPGVAHDAGLAADDLRGRPVRLDEQHERGASAGRLETEGARAGVEVEDVGAVEQPAVLEAAEEGLPDAVGRRPGR